MFCVRFRVTSRRDIDMNAVKRRVADDGVSAAGGRRAPACARWSTDASEKGIDLKIVVIDNNPPIDTPLRDIATEVGQAYPGFDGAGALSPSYAGTYSPTFDRVTLEAGQDVAKTGNPVQSSQNFVSQLTTPHFPWTGLTIVLVLAVLPPPWRPDSCRSAAKRADGLKRRNTA